MLLEHGLEGFRLDQTAAAAGTSARMLIHHFGSKDELVAAALTEARRRQLAMFDEHLERSEVTDLPTLLIAVRALLGSPEAQPLLRLFAEVHASAAREPERLPGFARASVHDWLPQLAKALSTAGYPADDAQALATLCLAVERGLLLDDLSTQEHERTESAHMALLRLLAT